VGVRHDMLAAYLVHLQPMCAVARDAFQGRAMRVPLLAAANVGQLALPALASHTARVQAWQPVVISFGALVRAQHAAVASRLVALDAAVAAGDEDEALQPAWHALAGSAAPGEEEFRTLYTMNSLGDAAIDDILRVSGLGDEIEAVWAREAHCGHVSSLKLCAAANALLAHAKMGPLRDYLRTAAALLELLCSYMSDSQEALTMRSELLTDVARIAAAATDPPSPPTDHEAASEEEAAAAGAPKADQATAAVSLAALPTRACSAALPAPGPGLEAAGGHFLRIWQSLLYHGVRPGLTTTL